ncbi:MAG: hypothetical protein KatS3mg089_0652 [Patescibacteria group bacterium]|nr:MAG: hypothetical protein KatS3mg089_0652 [Patescibacteria group bacterium]
MKDNTTERVPLFAVDKHPFYQNFAQYLYPVKGLSLLEMIIEIAILSILLVFVVILIDPISQIKKAKDATRAHDLNELKNSLDAYYNDFGCYPKTIPFGSEWRVGSTVYMSKVPQAPDCESNPANCYLYQVDQNDPCPQWNIIYVKNDLEQNVSCPLKSFSSSCIPPNYDTSWSCALSGNIDCSVVVANPVFSSLPVPPGSSPSPTGNQQVNPEKTPEDCPIEQRNYACRGDPIQRCNVVPQGTGTYCSPTCNGAC